MRVRDPGKDLWNKAENSKRTHQRYTWHARPSEENRKKKKGNNSEKMKKWKYTILRYSHKCQPAMLNHVICRAAISKNRGTFLSSFSLNDFFCFSDTFERKKTSFQKEVTCIHPLQICDMKPTRLDRALKSVRVTFHFIFVWHKVYCMHPSDLWRSASCQFHLSS